jgi:hypothetical protein
MYVCLSEHACQEILQTGQGQQDEDEHKPQHDECAIENGEIPGFFIQIELFLLGATLLTLSKGARKCAD